AEGVRTSCGERRPMRWSTVWLMARLGRPPVV
ncbi:glycosyltransferase family 2 protein, partial [Streptomyces zhihengii]